MKKLFTLAICCSAWFVAVVQAAPSNYPTHSIRLIAPYPAGGQTDIVARIVAPPLSEALGQSVVVENKPGGNGLVGHDFVAKAKPDGYTLLAGNSAMLAVTVSMIKDMPYDPRKDFAPIMLVGGGAYVLEVNPKLPVKNLAELIALAKREPGKLNFGVGGLGSIPHLLSEQIQQHAGIKWTNINYKGSGPMLIDLLGGQIDVTVDNVSSSLESIRAGRLRAIALTDKATLLPDVPTIEAAGLPGIKAYSWHGILAPAHTPPEVVAKLNEALRQIVKRPDVVKQLNSLGIDVIGGSPADFSAHIARENVHWADIVKSTGAKIE
ncbi:MAG: Bug family tripartite tricarboxylate transporter substrate binding protein [Janthinobacterium lividum]